jgi:sucrose-6-phosphate hydrolase SacC (GH32 family)
MRQWLKVTFAGAIVRSRSGKSEEMAGCERDFAGEREGADQIATLPRSNSIAAKTAVTYARDHQLEIFSAADFPPARPMINNRAVMPFLEIARSTALLAFAARLALPGNCGAQDLPVGTFGATNYGDWKPAGTAFRLGPASGGLLPKLEIENAKDNRVASSEIEGDGPTGTLASPEFTIARKYISFRVGGGDYERDTCLNLDIGGQIVRSATGWRSDYLAPASWDVTPWRGQAAQIQIVDMASGDWGHLNVDHIVQTDNPERLPVVTEALYRESLRPQFHFTARQWTMDRLNPGPKQEGWINDLNGLVYYDGEYHLFAQRWWKCWLHAVSRDLVHWTELEPAFWEESCETGDQSGTCVVDYRNTSGLSPDPGNPPMVAFWSRNDNRTQCVCYSLDHGRSWRHYEKNPVIIYPERDPKVFWYAPGNHWVMMLYGANQYHILSSTNLLNWTDEKKSVRDSFECPDIFELPVDGNRDNKQWVLIQGNGQYSIGGFDGAGFKEKSGRYACDIGPNFYATQTWGNTETGDGRRIQAAWMRGSSFPEMPFNQQISFPCELTLRNTPNGPRVFREPVREIALLHHGQDSWTNRVLKAREVLPLEPAGRLFHLQAEVDIPDGATLAFNLRGVPVVLASKTVESGGRPAQVADRIKTIEILVDRASIEVFVNHGEVSSTRHVLPHENGLSVKADGGAVAIPSLTVYPLNSAWPNGVSD